MLVFHRIEDIGNYPMAVIKPPSGTIVQTTLNDIKNDIGDYHLDHKNWWQQANHKTPVPTVSPKYGKAYPRLHWKVVKRVIRQVKTEYEARIGTAASDLLRIASGQVVIQNGAFIPPPPTYPCDTEGHVFIDFPGSNDRGVTTSFSPIDLPPGPPAPLGFRKVYWRTYRGIGHIDCANGQLVVTTFPIARYGSFNLPDPEYNMAGGPGTQQLTTLKDEFISNHKVARLNYFSFIDGKVLRKGISPNPDPTPVLEPLWKGQWLIGTTYDLSDIVKDGLETYFCIRKGKGKKPGTSPTWWERCNRPKTQIVAGVGVGNNPVTVSQFRPSTLGATGAQTYLFPDRADIKPACGRVYADSETQRDYRNFGDVFGIQVNGVSGFGNGTHPPPDPLFNDGVPILFLFAFGDTARTNGVANQIQSQSTSVYDSDGVAEFLVRQSNYGIAESVTITLQEETAP